MIATLSIPFIHDETVTRRDVEPEPDVFCRYGREQALYFAHQLFTDEIESLKRRIAEAKEKGRGYSVLHKWLEWCEDAKRQVEESLEVE